MFSKYIVFLKQGLIAGMAGVGFTFSNSMVNEAYSNPSFSYSEQDTLLTSEHYRISDPEAAKAYFSYQKRPLFKKGSKVTSEALENHNSALWSFAAVSYGLSPIYLYSISLQESGLKADNGKMIPWPWTLNCNGGCPYGSKRFSSHKKAKDFLEKAISEGYTNIDIGMMQVNYKYHGHKFKGLDLLDPRVNVLAGAQILAEYKKSSGGDIYQAIGRYHNGNPSIGGPYRDKVLKWKTRVLNRKENS